MKQIIDELNSNNSSNYKLQVLEKYKDNETFKKILYYTYNTNYNYYIKKIPEYISEGNFKSQWDSVFGILDSLRKRLITGNSAIELLQITLESIPKDDAKVLELIIGRDIKCGINTKSINKVHTNLIPITPYMGAITFDIKKAQKIFDECGYAFTETKEDGRYANVILADNNVNFVSRNGKATYIFGKLFHEFNEMYMKLSRDYVFNGELLVNGYDRLQANGIIASIDSINEKRLHNEDSTKDEKKFLKKYGVSYDILQDEIYMKVWDLIPYEFYLAGKWTIDREERLSILESYIKKDNLETSITLIDYKRVNSFEEAMIELKDKLSSGLEGIILKSPKQIWENKKPNGQIKLKVEIELDLEIIGFKQGKPGTKYENSLGSIHCKTKDGDIKVFVSGIPDEMRDEIWSRQDFFMNKIATVKCNGLSTNKEGERNLFFPNLIEIRYDKNEANTLNECIEIERSALELQ